VFGLSAAATVSLVTFSMTLSVYDRGDGARPSESWAYQLTGRGNIARHSSQIRLPSGVSSIPALPLQRLQESN
ncbi:MAG: hypothetical protein NTZ50_12390, partial [Chloroflexi bacterium]|nr:hypothetical protein [Chloroflexota bacterium]